MHQAARRRFRRDTPQQQAPQTGTAEVGGSSRRAFLRSSGGYATGAAVMVGVPAAVLLESPPAGAATATPVAVANPTTDVPEGPVMAYIHDAKKGTVVIVHGESERTVNDPLLVAKLTHTPRPAKKKKKKSVSTTSKRG